MENCLKPLNWTLFEEAGAEEDRYFDRNPGSEEYRTTFDCIVVVRKAFVSTELESYMVFALLVAVVHTGVDRMELENTAVADTPVVRTSVEYKANCMFVRKQLPFEDYTTSLALECRLLQQKKSFESTGKQDWK